jgi:hypothetical protein
MEFTKTDFSKCARVVRDWGEYLDRYKHTLAGAAGFAGVTAALGAAAGVGLPPAAGLAAAAGALGDSEEPKLR